MTKTKTMMPAPTTTKTTASTASTTTPAATPMLLLWLALLLAAASATASHHDHARQQPFHMDNLVTFGDSYSDESRFAYFVAHHGPPPAGQLLPASNRTYSGGLAWPRVVARRTGARSYNYAVAGAMCSDAVVGAGRTLGPAPGLPFPSVAEYEVPAFRADAAVRALYPDRRPDNTVYALWIGTNDLGIDGFLVDAQRPAATLASLVDCVWAALDALYAAGGRRFVVFNQLPLQLAPLYAPDSPAWRRAGDRNATAMRAKLAQYTAAVNALLDAGAPLQLCLRARWPGAALSVLDAHAIVADVAADPARFLDAPADAVAPFRNGSSEPVDAPGRRLSSFLWYDELHPSERMQEIFAQAFIDVINGSSKYGTTYRD